ncbi:MAG: hypothetical protein IPM51_16225 [Sphingobacteriaceae bacterium]|nr:hypothetical protein [Sphingobacteriaceae bacterium]
MNYDYIETSTFVKKDKIYFGDLEPISVNRFGWENFSISLNNNLIQVRYNNVNNELKIQGSLPKFIEGQNYQNENNKISEAIYILSDTIDFNLFDSTVLCLETGITFETMIKPKYIFNSHRKIKGMKTQFYDKGIEFKGSLHNIKFYDAGYRMKKALSNEIRENLTYNKGYNPQMDYLRFEIKYKKPSHFFRREVIVKCLFDEKFNKECKINLMEEYNKIVKTGYYKIPENKRQCNFETLEWILLCEKGLEFGFSPEDCLKSLINSIPESNLNKEDKKNRKKKINAIKRKIKANEGSRYDLSQELKKGLGLQ